jgi:hypothetical protein
MDNAVGYECPAGILKERPAPMVFLDTVRG